ncbi:MAG TPA: diguanylate cyclase [Synergistaceae bacterium]|nr:diguanylate cyclase [Synergistaceae bacterium]
MTRREKSPQKFFSLPLFLSLPLVIVLLFLRGSRSAPPNLSPFWMVSLFWYSILTSTYAVLVYKNMREKLSALQLQAQGILVLTLTLYLNAPPSIAWMGAALLIIGIIIQEHHYALPSGISAPAQKKNASPAPSSEEMLTSVVKSLVDNLGLPAFLTTLQGKIFEKNDTFTEFLKKKNISAESLTVLQRNAMDDEGVIHGPENTFWTLGITPFEHMYLVCLEPFLPAGKASPETSGSSALASPVNAKGLYVSSYAPIRLKEELERVQRYRRILSVLLISVELTSGNRTVFEEEQERAFSIFCAILKHTIRTSDVGIELPRSRVLVLLPETNREGGKTFVKRLQDRIRQEAYEGEGQAAPLLPPSEELHLHLGYALASGNTPTTPEEIMEEAEKFLNEKREV